MALVRLLRRPIAAADVRPQLGLRLLGAGQYILNGLAYFESSLSFLRDLGLEGADAVMEFDGMNSYLIRFVPSTL